ncbi:MAG: hypothetical protein U9P71_01955 [Campylobacterota bacterium]|nr:hypothetical protein [Campylobacterota bacterium]
MSVSQIRREVDSLILNSGMKPDIRMHCSILRALKLRHRNIDSHVTHDIIMHAIKKLV